MADIRGQSFITINNWLKQNLGDGYNRFISGLRPPVAKVISRTQEWEWYPSQYLAEIYTHITSNMGNIHGNLKPLSDLGKFLAELDLEQSSQVTHCFPMDCIMERLPRLWQRFRSCGQLEVTSVDEEKKFAEIMLADCIAGPMHTEVTRAWIETAVGSMCECKITVNGQSYPEDAYYWKISWS